MPGDLIRDFKAGVASLGIPRFEQDGSVGSRALEMHFDFRNVDSEF